jgi:transcriptional regulator with XRE-family HTH domain
LHNTSTTPSGGEAVEDFGKMLRRLREERGWSLRYLGERSGVDYSNISRAEHGKGGLSERSVEYLVQALGAGDELLEAYRAGDGTTGHSVARWTVEDSVQRRILIQNALAALAGGATLPALDTIRAGLVSSVTGQDPRDADVAEWEDVAQEYGAAYFTQRPDELVTNLGVDLADLQGVLDVAPERTHRELSRVAGLLSAIMAMSWVNLGQFQPARRWWWAARKAADASTDPAVRVWVRAHDAVHGLYDQRPLRSALARADDALAISGTAVYPGTAEALGGRAQALALLGRDEDARTAVRALADVFEQLPTDTVGDTGTMYGWPEQRLWHTTSYVFTHLSDTTEAGAAQQRALALYPTTSPRSRAQVELHAARCLVLDGDFDDGADRATAVIDALPTPHRTALVLGMGSRVFDAVPPAERGRSAVTDLGAMLALPAGPVAR